MRSFLLLGLLIGQGVVASESLIGIYDLKVDISGREFIDVLTFEKSDNQGNLDGFFEVPGVFKSRFRGKLIEDQLKGEFVANERGENFVVKLEASIENSCTLTGSLLQSDRVFGNFIGKKRDCNE